MDEKRKRIILISTINKIEIANTNMTQYFFYHMLFKPVSSKNARLKINRAFK